jgi:hypothetical protein
MGHSPLLYRVRWLDGSGYAASAPTTQNDPLLTNVAMDVAASRDRIVGFLLALFVVAASAIGLRADDAPANSACRLCSFSADVTIPLGHRCMGVLSTKSQRIADPLLAHGFVLLGPEPPIVMCAIDWCEIRNGAYDQWREALAHAANTTRERVLVSSLHQHDAPVVDRDAAEHLRQVGLPDELYHESFHDQTVRRVADALAQSLRNPKPITHLGLGQAKVDKIASNRRVVYPDGRVTFDRGSASGGIGFHREQPEGEIDPFLKTLSFWNGDTPLLALHAYATHPMSYYGRGEVSSDFVGLARDRRQRDDFSVHQIFVAGCSGDVTAGKYNDGSLENREVLRDRLYDAMVESWRQTVWQPIEQIVFRHAELDLEFHPHPTLTAESLHTSLDNSELSTEKRILAALGLASRRRVESGQKIDLPAMDLGVAQVVLLPGESFVGYQLAAQRMRPDSFVITIGYGECWPGYIPTESAFRDGFADNWLWSSPGSEARIHAALRHVLRGE